MQNPQQTTLLPTAASTGGTFPWSNPSRITADDGSSATLFPGGSTSGWIRGSTFGFSLPPFAVIDGIGVYIDGSEGSTSSTINIGIAGTDTPGASFGVENGGSEEKWGLDEITVADLASLEVTIDTTTFGAGGSASIDYISVTVYWHVALENQEADVPTRVSYKSFSREGTYLGELPNVTSKFGFAHDINSAGSSIVITCAESVRNEVIVSPLLTEGGDIITTENNLPILTTSTELLVTTGDSPDASIFKNSNRVQVWIYNKYYPNGKLMFAGQVNKVEFSYGSGSSQVSITVYSDGFDMANYLLTPSSSFAYTDDVSQTTQNTSSNVTLYTEGIKETIISRLLLGQTFKTGAIAKLGAIKLLLQGTANVKVDVYNAVNGTYLGGGSKFVSSASAAVAQIPLTIPIDVSASTTYFFAVSVYNGETIKVFRTTANPYADGVAYQASGTGGWVAIAGDLYFVTQSASEGSTITEFTLDDPVSEMASSILTDYNARGGYITERDLVATGLSITYEFNSATVFDAMRKIIELSPSGYYMCVDLGTAEIDIKPVSGTADFIITKGNEINSLNLVLSTEQVKNHLLFVGGDTGGGLNLFRQYPDNESIGNYGLRVVFKSDDRVTLPNTANAIGESFIEENADESQETAVTVLNENIDITQLTPGKTIGFRNFGNFVDDMVLQIVRREYTLNAVTLTLGRLPVRLNDELQRLNREMLNQQTINNPSSPS